ncbi:MAG: hypothetical protein K8F27_15710, partial [Sulfuricellaceae bacterium]|nr:hypothetical protein [Sulfuricellaceae bacterium]
MWPILEIGFNYISSKGFFGSPQNLWITLWVSVFQSRNTFIHTEFFYSAEKLGKTIYFIISITYEKYRALRSGTCFDGLFPLRTV